MTCIPFQSADGKIVGHFCESPVHTVASKGKKWTFEYHRYFGPTVLRKDGEPRVRQPGPRSLFWAAFARWERRQERRRAAGRVTTA